MFGDRQQVALGSIAPDAPAAVVAARVTSLNPDDRRFVIDAGAKTLTKDVPAYLAGHGAIPELGGVVARVSDYHGVVELGDEARRSPTSDASCSSSRTTSARSSICSRRSSS